MGVKVVLLAVPICLMWFAACGTGNESGDSDMASSVPALSVSPTVVRPGEVLELTATVDIAPGKELVQGNVADLERRMKERWVSIGCVLSGSEDAPGQVVLPPTQCAGVGVIGEGREYVSITGLKDGQYRVTEDVKIVEVATDEGRAYELSARFQVER